MVSQEIIFQKGVKNDVSEVNIQSEFAWFLKNIDFPNDVKDPGAQTFKPLQKNIQFGTITFPAGDNYTIGFHYAKEIKKAFAFCFNSNNNHGIYRLNPEDKTVTKVIVSPCLNFQRDPQYFIGEGRVAVFTQMRLNRVSGVYERITILKFVDNFNYNRRIYVEDSIATNGFTLAPYFTAYASNPEYNTCNYISVGVPTPLDCITVTPIARDMTDADERNKPNRINYNGWEFRVKMMDVWGEESEHGSISEQYINVVGSSCLGESSALPRCLDLAIEAGSPLTDKIQIEFRTCSANQPGVSTVSDWFLYDVIDKYDNSQDVHWWQRSINPDLDYDSALNVIHYTFCGDKQCTPIPVTETNRVENPVPLSSSSIFSLGNTVAYARNKRRFQKIDPDQLAKIVFSVQNPIPSLCERSLRTITIWAVIYNGNESRNVPIRKKDGKNVFGLADYDKNNPFAYNQVFPDNQEGFIGYLAGTKNYCVSTQWVYDVVTKSLTEVGLTGKLPEVNPFYGGLVYMQKFELKALPGKYIFRIASHNAKPTDEYEKTSTYYLGQSPVTALTLPSSQSREMLVDICDDDFTQFNNPVIICDLTKTGKSSLTSASKVTAGYIYEDDTNKIPIERASVMPNQNFGIAPLRTVETDYNGFYFAWSTTRGLETTINGIKNCVANSFLAKSRTALDQADLWFRHDVLYAYLKPAEYLQKDRFYVSGRVVLQSDPTIGVPGVLVNLTRGGYTFTDTDGEFKLLAHNVGSGIIRTDDIIYSQRGACEIVVPGDPCDYCFPLVPIIAPACGPDENILTVANLQVELKGVNLKGPTHGGRYGLGVVFSDGIRQTGVQRLPSFYLDIPSIQKTKSYEYSKILFSIDPGFAAPAEFKKMMFHITDNLNEEQGPFSWVAERVQMIDNSGNVNTSAPTQIRLYYEGLNEYNKQNNFATNTAWQFLTDDNKSIIGDQVEFVANGDGTIFDQRITALVKYDATGKYIQVDYNDALKGLKDGALIRLIRPKQCESEEFYYQIGCPIYLSNGLPEDLTGELPLVDSYMQTRQIPVPVEVKKKTTVDGNEIETSTSENQIRNYPFLFEHHSPSDLWGDHCHGRGRVSVVDKYEKRVLNRMEFALAKSLTENSTFNGLTYFSEEDIINFSDQAWGGITLVIPDQNTLLVLCENDNFIVGYNDNTVRIDEQGNVVAYSAANRFGKPQRKTGNHFGCSLEDVNTVRESGGKVVFVDSSKAALVVHNYNEAVNVARGLFTDWLTRKIKHVKQWNKSNPSNIKYLHAGISPKNEDYHLSVSRANHPNDDYINNEFGENIQAPETVVFNIRNFVYKGQVSFVPEYYGYSEADLDDLQLYTFIFGQAWYHYRREGVAATDYNTFYGSPCHKVIQVVANLGGASKIKEFMTLEVYCKHQMFFANLIETDTGQYSRLMPFWFERADNFWKADFKCATNTIIDANLPEATNQNALLDGEQLRGKWMKIRLIGKAADQNKYFELTSIKIGMIAMEKSG